MRRAAGFNLVEMAVALVVGATLVAVGVPPLLEATARTRVRLAAAEVTGVLYEARSYAVLHSANVAVKFRAGADGGVDWSLYRDADGDGVLTQDIESGVDPRVGPARQLAHLGRQVRVGFPPGPAPRDPGDPRRRLDRLTDPVRFNRSDLASFDPLGGATPGSIYLTDGRSHLVAVRVLGVTGRVRVLVYDAAREAWE